MDLKIKLLDLLNKIENVIENGDYDDEFHEVRSKLILYNDKFFKNSKYTVVLDRYNSSNLDSYFLDVHSREIKSIILAMIEELELNNSDIDYQNETDRKKVLEKIRLEAQKEKENLQKEIESIRSIGEEIRSEREQLVSEADKFDEFKQKLEVADKEITFEELAQINRVYAQRWLYSGIAISVMYLIFLYMSIFDYHDLIKIVSSIDAAYSSIKSVQNTSSNVLHFSILIYCVKKLLFTSVFIIGIVFCIKNYNAQMHNRIINLHKSQALSSAKSLLNTAKTDEGKDKLLIQASSAIFSHQHTGYSKKENDQSGSNLINNVIDTASSKL